MHPWGDTDSFPVLDSLCVTLKGGDDKHVTIIASYCLTHCSSPHSILTLWVSLKHVEVPLKISVGVWVAVRQINCILVVLKRALPGQCVVIPSIFTLHRILIIADIVADSDPPTSSFLSWCIRIHQGSHSMVIKWVRLDQVNNIESIVLTSLGVTDTEVVPLSIPSRVIVRLQN